MVFPYKGHSRQIRSESLHWKVVDGVNLGAMATNTTYTVNVPPGFFRISLAAWKTDNSDGAINVKLFPYVDDNQTITNGGLYAYELGSSTVASVLDIASSNTSAGHVWEVVPDAGSAGNKLGGTHPMHNHAGFQITVDVNTNATTSATVGDFHMEIHAERGSGF